MNLKSSLQNMDDGSMHRMQIQTNIHNWCRNVLIVVLNQGQLYLHRYWSDVCQCRDDVSRYAQTALNNRNVEGLVLTNIYSRRYSRGKPILRISQGATGISGFTLLSCAVRWWSTKPRKLPCSALNPQSPIVNTSLSVVDLTPSVDDFVHVYRVYVFQNYGFK